MTKMQAIRTRISSRVSTWGFSLFRSSTPIRPGGSRSEDYILGLSDEEIASEQVQEQLSRIAQDHYNDAYVRGMAMQRVADPALRAVIARRDPSWRVRQTATTCLTDQGVLADIARQDPVWAVRLHAVNRLADTALLAGIAQTDENRRVRDVAMQRLAALGASETATGDYGPQDPRGNAARVDSIENGTIAKEAAEWLLESLSDGRSILVTGRAASGKTVLIDSLARRLAARAKAEGRSIVICERSRELMGIDGAKRFAEEPGHISPKEVFMSAIDGGCDYLVYNDSIPGGPDSPTKELLDAILVLHESIHHSCLAGHYGSARHALEVIAEHIAPLSSHKTLVKARELVATAFPVVVECARPTKENSAYSMRLYSVAGVDENGEFVLAPIAL